MKLQGKTAFITGGTSGIGLATANLFEQEGANVTIIGRREELISAYNSNSSDKAFGLVADVSEQESIKDAINKTVSDFGNIDIVFINAGIANTRLFTEVDRPFYDTMWDINFAGTYFTIQRILPFLNEGASIVLNTSIAGVKGVPGMSIYGPTKAAMRSLARTLASELSDKKIRVNAVSPGPIETPIWGKMDLPEEGLEFKKQVSDAIPLGRMGTSEEVARVVLFLASSESSFVNGIELPVDGGMAQV